MAKKKEVVKTDKVETKEKEKNKKVKETAKVKTTKKAKKNKKEKKGNIFSKIWRYLKSVKTEMGKVRWPNKKEMLLYSGATLGFIIIFALFFMLNDVVISAVKQLVR